MKHLICILLSSAFLFISCKKEEDPSIHNEPRDPNYIFGSTFLEFNSTTNSLNVDGEPFYQGFFKAYRDEQNFHLNVNKNETYHFTAINAIRGHNSYIQIIVLNSDLDTLTIGERDVYFTPSIDERLHVRLQLTSIYNQSLSFNFHVETTGLTEVDVVGVPMECRGDWKRKGDHGVDIQLHHSGNYRIIRPLTDIPNFSTLSFTIKSDIQQGETIPEIGVCFGGSYTFNSRYWSNYAYSIPETGTLILLESNTEYNYTLFYDSGSSSSSGGVLNQPIDSKAGINFRLQNTVNNEVRIYINNEEINVWGNNNPNLNTLYFVVKEEGYAKVSFENIDIN